MAPGVLERISFEELYERTGDRSLAIVNVLPPESFRLSRIAGSINLPLADIRDRARAMLPDPTSEIIVYCGSFT
jgi:rhodanese-related sulfurtransferase